MLSCMSMSFPILLAVAATFSAGDLREVASFPELQVTGVAVSQSGRIFVNFPQWSDTHTISVAEIVDGQPRPFPNETWNAEGPASTHFVCVQSVYVDALDRLWVLDPASPKMAGVVADGPKLVEIDLQTNKSIRIIPLGEVAPAKSYLNDVRVDTKANVAFLTDSGLGALVVVDLKTGNARRVLAGHPSTQAETDVTLTVQGRKVLTPEGKTPLIHSDGIALDAAGGFLYYHALTGRTLYRIPTAALIDDKLSPEALAAKVEKLGQTAPPDGMLEGPDGAIYLTDLEGNGISRFRPASGEIERVVQDERLNWPDSLAWGPDGSLYVTASQIEHMPRFNNGQSMRTTPYQVFRIAPASAK